MMKLYWSVVEEEKVVFGRRKPCLNSRPPQTRSPTQKEWASPVSEVKLSWASTVFLRINFGKLKEVNKQLLARLSQTPHACGTLWKERSFYCSLYTVNTV
jgi:hypothetical protein